MGRNWQKERIVRSKKYQLKAYEEVNELVYSSRKGKVLTLTDGSQLVEFVSCSYLGLDMRPDVIGAVGISAQACGVTFSAARTRVRAENLDILDGLLKRIFCNAYPVVFTSVHMAHLGCLPMLGSGELPSFPAGENGFAFILDKTCHASIQINRSLLEQFGSVSLICFSQKEDLRLHADLAQKSSKRPVFIADGVGSMGGVAPVDYLIQLAELHDGYVYLDDAHGTSVFGQNGCGYVLDQLAGEFHPRLIITASMSKAFGTACGGVLLLPTVDDWEMIRRFASTYIFGGPPALPVVDTAIASAKIHLTNKINILQNKLRENIRYFDSLVQVGIINKGSWFPIRGILIGDEVKTVEGAKLLRERGIAVTAAMYPAVAKGRGMLRVALSAVHDRQQLLKLSEGIKAIRQAQPAELSGIS